MSMLLIAPALFGLAIILVFIGLARSLSASGQQIDKRLEQYATRATEDLMFISGSEQFALVGEDDQPVRGGLLGRWLKKRGDADPNKVNSLRSELGRANLKLKPHEWQLFQLLTIVVLILIGFIIFRQWILALLLGVLGLFLPGLYLRYRQSQRLNAFDKMLSDALVMMSNSMRAGYSFLQSMDVLSKEMPDPTAMEFGRVVREVELGLTQQQALANLLRRIPSEDLDMAITAVNVQQEVGGNLAEILDTLAHTIRERVRIQGEIRVLVAQGMLSGYVITFLPVALALYLFLTNRPYMSNLYSSACGWLMIGYAVLSVAMGFVAIQKIVKIEV